MTCFEVFLSFLSAVEKKAKESTYKTDSTGRSRRLYDNGDVIAQVFDRFFLYHVKYYITTKLIYTDDTIWSISVVTRNGFLINITTDTDSNTDTKISQRSGCPSSRKKLLGGQM